MRTVDDLLRHYPRGYTEGTAVRGGGDERPAAGAPIPSAAPTTATKTFPMRKTPSRVVHKITVGSGSRKMTATFFNANYIKKDLTKDAKVMLSGEVGYFRGEMQLTHPAFLVLEG